MSSDDGTESNDKSAENSGSDDGQREPGEVSDEQLPEDVRPSEENPLARHPDQTGDPDDVIGQDREDGTVTAPLDKDQADYGSGGSA